MRITLNMVIEQIDADVSVVQKEIYRNASIASFEPTVGGAAALAREGGEVAALSAEGLGAEALASHANAALARLSAWGERLAMAVARGASLPHFVEIAAEALANPIALFSMDGTVLATAGSFTGSIEGTVWEQIESGALNWGYYAKADMEVFEAGIGKVDHLLFNPEADPAHEYLSSFIRVGGEITASLGLVDINAPITPGQVDLVRHISEMASLYLRGNDLYLRLAQSSDSMLLALLDGGEVSDAAVDLWLADRGFARGSGLSVAVIRPSDPESSGEAVLPRAARAVELVPRSLSCRRGDELVLLCGADSQPALGTGEGESGLQALDALLASRLSGIDCSWGISSTFTASGLLSRAYGQARLASLRAMEAGGAGMELRDCLVDAALSAVADSLGEGVACDLRLAGIMDAPSGADLVESLCRYLLAGANAAAAARALHIHRNTMIYRIGRICELLGATEDDLAHDAEYWLLSCATLLRGR